MPGPESSDGELDGLMDDLTNTGSSSGDTQQLQDPSTQQSTSEGQQKLYGGKYKTLQDYDKAHKSQQSAYTQAQQKLKTLDGILKNPQLLAAAQQDPQLRAALAQAGYSQVEEESAEQRRNDPDGNWNGDENDPRYLRVYFDTVRAVDKETAKIERELGREFSTDEWSEIKQIYKAVPGIGLRDAWKLSNAYEAIRKQAEDKRVNDAVSKRGGNLNRPKPPSSLVPGGQKAIDLKKPLGQMSPQEKEGLIQDILNNPAAYKK